MNFRRYLHQARRWVIFAVLPAIAVAVVGYEYTAHQPQTYSATATLYVNQASGTTPGGADIQTSEALAPTYTQMIASPVMAPAVDHLMAKRYPAYRLGLVAATQPPGLNTQLIDVSVTDTDPARAAAAANTLAQAFITRISRLEQARFATDGQRLATQVKSAQAAVNTITRQIASYQGNPNGLTSLNATLASDQNSYSSLLAASQQFNLGRDAAKNSVSVYSPASIPTTPTSPSPKRMAIIYAFVGLLLFGGAVYAYDYLDDSLRSPEEIEELAGVPVVGSIERFKTPRDRSELITAREPRSTVAEAYRLLRTNLQFAAVGRPLRTVLITSPHAQEGKSTTAGNLARVIAESGRRVTLIDGDLRRPALHRIFGMERRLGGLTTLLLSEHLNGAGVARTDLPNLAVVASGPLPPNPADLLGSQRMQAVIDHLGAGDEMVMIDSPPVLSVADAAILAAMVDGVVLVVDPGHSKRRDVIRSREALEAVGAHIIGVVINRLKKSDDLYYYYASQYHYDSAATEAMGAEKRAEKKDQQAAVVRD